MSRPIGKKDMVKIICERCMPAIELIDNLDSVSYRKAFNIPVIIDLGDLNEADFAVIGRDSADYSGYMTPRVCRVAKALHDILDGVQVDIAVDIVSYDAGDCYCDEVLVIFTNRES